MGLPDWCWCWCDGRTRTVGRSTGAVEALTRNPADVVGVRTPCRRGDPFNRLAALAACRKHDPNWRTKRRRACSTPRRASQLIEKLTLAQNALSYFFLVLPYTRNPSRTSRFSRSCTPFPEAVSHHARPYLWTPTTPLLLPLKGRHSWMLTTPRTELCAFTEYIASHDLRWACFDADFTLRILFLSLFHVP